MYNNLQNIDLNKWQNLQTIIQVDRKIEFLNNQRIYTETAFFISSLPITTKAAIFNQGVRSHWSIENSLHYIKDTTFHEDASKIRTGNAPENLSLLRNVAINVFRQYGFKNIAQAIRLVSHDIGRMWNMLA